MVAFAANSILCRLALTNGSVDPQAFTLVRLVSGAAVLWIILALAGRGRHGGGSWSAAAALFAYAAAFSAAYITLSAGTGALLLFGAVQATMLALGRLRGERLSLLQAAGFAISLLGLARLVAPGVQAPPLIGALLMASAGLAWGLYSHLGRGTTDPLAATAGNFLRAAPMALLLLFAVGGDASGDHMGLIYAVLSGAVASGLGYTIWYAALPGLTAAQGASMQLSVPMITAVAGWLLLGEVLTERLLVSSVAILGGITLVIFGKRSKTEDQRTT